MSSAQDNNNNNINRKHSRSDGDGLEVSQHDKERQDNQENSPTKRSKVNFSAQVQTPTSEELDISMEVDINNSGDQTAVASNDNGISAAPTAVHATRTESPHSPTATDPGPTADNNSLPHQEIPSYSQDYVNDLFCEQFKEGKWFDSPKALEEAVKVFGDKYHFVMRRDSKRILKCSRSSNTNSKKKDAMEKTMSTKSFSAVTNCEVEIRHSVRGKDDGKVQINYVSGRHNHPLDVPHVAVSQRLAGRDIESVLPMLAPHFAPHLKNGRSVDITTARNIIEAHIGENVSYKSDSIDTIVRAVKKYINSGKYKQCAPPIDSKSMLSQFSTYVASDFATENCVDYLEQVVSNSSGDTSWKVLQLLESLKRADPNEFDYRVHKDSAGNIDAFTWQTGVQRASFQLYGDALFLDARKKETMNVLGMKYMTVVVIDANNKFWPIGHSFVFAEDHTLYGFACNAMLEMTPNRTKESVKLGYGDMFFEPERVKEWFPNILMMIDSFHLMFAKNGQSILAKEFGPTIWNSISGHFKSALEAETKELFDVSLCDFQISFDGHCTTNNFDVITPCTGGNR